MEQDSELFSKRFINEVLEALEHELSDAETREVVFSEQHSNDIAEVRFNDGRALMIKRARYSAADARFETSGVATRLLRKEAGVVAPRHLDLPLEIDQRPVIAYWRIPLPTLRGLWPDVPEEDRPDVLRNMGELMQHMHSIRLPGHGLLLEAESGAAPLDRFLTRDLDERLLPAVRGTWPAGTRVVERLIEAVPAVAERKAETDSVLVHNDLWMANVLCEIDDGAVECVGVLDLEDAFAGPPEADLAKTEVLHGPLFGNELAGPWFERVWEGYGGSLDPVVLAFFRAYHLVNMGFHAATVGYAEHAADVARAAEAETHALP